MGASAHLAAAGETVAAKLVENYDCLLLDLDGVVYEGPEAIHGAVESIAKVQKQGKSIAYVTNNSSRKPNTIVEQLAGFGVEAAEREVVSSAQTGVQLLATLVPAGSKILVVGGEGLRYEVQNAGFELVQSSDDSPAAVIQGFSPDVAWTHLAEAAYSIQNGAKWVATNSDWTIPREKGIAPGNGTLVSAVHTAVGQLPVVAGKPEPAIFKTAVERFAAKAPLFVGDRLDTDIAGANRSGIDSAVVMTGVCNKAMLLSAKPEERPTFILNDMTELFEKYEQPKQTRHGYSCGKAQVELLLGKVKVIAGDPASLDALKAACAVIWNAETNIHQMEVDPALYE